MDFVHVRYLLNPKERSMDGVCNLLEEAKKDLKKAQAKKNPNNEEIEEKFHRVKILELKKAKYERISDEKKKLPPHMADQNRKDSTLILVEKINAEIDDRTTDAILTDAISLLGDSLDLSRFLSYFNEGEESSSGPENAGLFNLVRTELAKTFGFGDELLAKLIINHGMKSNNEEEFEDTLQKISNQYHFSDGLVTNLYTMICAEKNKVFKPDELENRLNKLKQDIGPLAEKFAKSVEDRDKMLIIVVDTVSFWSDLLEITNLIKTQLALEKFESELVELISLKKKLGKHTANLFSTVSYIRASINSWNLENATSTMDEATRSLFRVTFNIIDANIAFLKLLKEAQNNRPQGQSHPQGDPKKLAKFFGVQPSALKKVEQDPLSALIVDDPFSRDLFFTMEGNIKGGSLPKLVERLTHHCINDSDFIYAFLLTYRSFTDPKTLFMLLVNRFQLTPPEKLNPAEKEYYIEKKIKPLQLKVLEVLSRWIEMDNVLFQTDDDIKASLIEFSITKLKETIPNAAELISSMLNGATNSHQRVRSFNDKTPAPVMPKSLKNLTLTAIDPLEIARHLTILDFQIFSKIAPKEFFKQAWTKKDSNNAPNINALIRRSTHLTSFLCAKILEEPDVRQRGEILKHWILVADRCRFLQNYNSVMAIQGGLMSSSIHRLQKTWKQLSKRESQLLEEIRELMNYRRNFGEYRTAIKSAKPPCIPFLGLYLTDLTFIDDGNKDFLANSDFINFDKRMKTAKVIQEIETFQQAPYNFQVIPQIEEFLSDLSSYEKNEEEFYEISQNVEKKDPEPGDSLSREQNL